MIKKVLGDIQIINSFCTHSTAMPMVTESNVSCRLTWTSLKGNAITLMLKMERKHLKDVGFDGSQLHHHTESAAANRSCTGARIRLCLYTYSYM